LIFQREKSATLFLDGIQQGTFQAEEVPLEELRQLSLFESESIDEVVRANWGNIGPGSTEEKLATMRRFNNDLRPGGGDPNRGKLLFEKQCGICHKLHSEGNKIGPDLTTANRKDRAALLANIVDPNAVIRREYLSYIVTTNSGQVVTGLLTEQDAASITVLDAKNARIKISRDEVEEIQESSVSLMPERILENLNPEEIRDLFSYLQN
jgi:putative heme-binding domain-containing protein